MLVEKHNVVAGDLSILTIVALFSYSRDCNNTIMELLIMAYACKTSTARRVVGVIPYLPYSQQCKNYLNFPIVLSPS